MKDFWDGKVDILCATEIAGMGMDIQDVPVLSSSWSHLHFLSGNSALAMLEDLESLPSSSFWLNLWCTSYKVEGCYAYFDNPLCMTDLIVLFCDLCVLKKVANGHVELTPAEANLMMLYDHIRSHEVLAAPATNGVAQQAKECSDDGHATGTTDLQATKQACHPDIKEEILEWIWADEYGEAVLKLLEPIDQLWCKENEQEKAENKAKQSKVSAERNLFTMKSVLQKPRHQQCNIGWLHHLIWCSARYIQL
ncbi:hypothetical protein F5148DRAFT_1152557 [Russula earlei]|uniref:Uncharacterized protein n=1 Tax=Russula earlei TaxID=71964 RepID=A0ACC0TXA9_9AGAM|nr:hypothetical protein F5148DRAFT_1152557 [Russula earlei]